ncbi:MAG: LysM peptidoglycan-binding domain-containing protein [Desulfohalobiaceae bacterium]|nr:LysM peptidoglycan-binding domain-containing protein [Desulfohalobiaceae bacterium]
MAETRGKKGRVGDRPAGLTQQGPGAARPWRLSTKSLLGHETALNGLLCFLVLTLCQGWALASDQVYELRFEKTKTLEEREDCFTYTIEKGDYVYAILRRFNVSEAMLEEMNTVVKRLNPQIEDLDLVKPGDSLHLPVFLQDLTGKKEKQRDPRQAKGNAGSLRSIEYRVKPGDTVFQILLEKTGLPKKIVADRYLGIFRGLNPKIKDIDRIVAGQNLRVPLPPMRAGSSGGQKSAQVLDSGGRGQAASAKSPQRDSSGQDLAQVQEDKGLAERDLVQSILEQAGLDFVQGGEILLPGSKKNWIRINLEHMGLARTKWGDSILFVPGALRDKEDEAAFSGAGLKTCLIPESWERTGVFRSLEEITRPRLLFWPPGKPLILNFQGASLELKANCLLAKGSDRGYRFYLFDSSMEQRAGPSGLLTGFLQAMGVNYLTLGAGARDWTVSAFPNRDSLFVPTISRSGFLPELKEILPANKLPAREVPGDFASVFPVLKAQGLARQELLQIKLYQADGVSITLRLPVVRASVSSGGEVFLLSEEQSDAYLISMLNMMGYSSYRLDGN